VRFKVEIRTDGESVWLAGEGRLADKTVLMGAPRSGKSTFLKLLYSLLVEYEDESRMIAKDVASHVLESGGLIDLVVEGMRLRCSTGLEDIEPTCSRDGGSRSEPAYLFYEGFELSIREGLKPQLYQNMMARLDAFVAEQKIRGRYAILRSEGRWYEIFENRRIPLSNSSNAVAVVGYLERAARLERGWLLIDGVLDQLYPEDALYAAARLLTSRAKVVVTTHSPWVKDLFLCYPSTLRLAGLEAAQKIDVTAYEVVKGSFTRIDFSSYGDIYSKLYEGC
jgi:predicted ATPase